MSSDPIGDLFAILQNANHKLKEHVDFPASNLKKEVVRLLKEEGYVSGFKLVPDRKQGQLRVFMKYTSNNGRVIRGMKRVSRPGLRIYRGADELPKVQGGLGVAIVSTSKGLMSDQDARRKKMGGEIIGYIW
ncbi:MAG TPA: 30S ribosomal protein S8 [Elusimicrobiota bacterium]|nr:30S ribosomal protein S8 [Elusimicrobiota bacterium]